MHSKLLSTLVWLGCPVLGLSSACKKSTPETQAPAGQEPAVSGAWGPANSHPEVVNIVPVVFDKSADVPGKVAEECQLQTKLPEFIQASAEGVNVALANTEAGALRVLTIRVVSMMGASGGLYTGPKQLKVEGELRNGQEVIGSFRAQRTTTGGMFGGYKGTCSLLGRNTKTLGEDIGVWLQNPSKDAKLGELK